MLDKRKLEVDFIRSIEKDSNIKRSKKRERKRKLEKPLQHLLKYLGNDLRDLRGEGFKYSSRNSKEKENYQLFFKLWESFLIEKGLVEADNLIKDEVPEERVETPKVAKNSKVLKSIITEKIISVDESEAIETKEKLGVTSHAQYKLFNIPHLMDELGIGTREIEEGHYKSETTREEQLAIENLGRRIYRESELIKMGNSNGRTEIFKYFYHWDYNLITILPEDEESIVTIYGAYIDKSMAEEILLEKRRSEKLHSATLRETQISYRRVKDLLEYRKRQVEMLEKQKEALDRSIGVIEETLEENCRDIKRIINEKKFLAKE